MSILKLGIIGAYHNISPKHTGRYTTEFAGRHNNRPADTVDQMRRMVRGMAGKLLRFRELTGWIPMQEGEL